jgi:hypothetical protein
MQVLSNVDKDTACTNLMALLRRDHGPMMALTALSTVGVRQGQCEVVA